MKKLTLISLTIASAALVGSASATTVQFSAASATTQRAVVLNDGITQVTAGSLVMLGAFSNAGNFVYNPAASVQTNFNNMLTAGGGGFSEFGLAQPGNGASEASTYTLAVNVGFGASQVSGSIIDNNGTAGSGLNASFFDNKVVYLVIFNGTSIVNSSQMGVFTSAAWTFKANTQGLGGDSSTFATSTGTAVTAVQGGGTVSAGSVNAGPNQLELATTVPEPSTLATLAGATGLIALLRRRQPAQS